ncbi:twin-arginine translocation signal domain-containing protein, partial [Streptomyces sp. NPDC087850]|uniref:twin-arginine translocation signal domain-containing protein n=1 Tax=Streptomyces sp. NPDC087850 TaxID=3365809 RepID=UPI00382FCBDD
MCSPLHQPDGACPDAASPDAAFSDAGRRTFLRATALAGATAAVGLTGVSAAEARTREVPAVAAESRRPDTDSPRFTLVVMPDTQYLFDGDSLHSAPVEASLRYVLDHRRDENIVFLSHLGDLTEHGTAQEYGPLSDAFKVLDRQRVGYSVVTGNHDIDSSTDDRRGRTPYLDAFGPQRLRALPTFGGATPDGDNTYHLFRAAGREWL